MSTDITELVAESPVRWRIERHGDMRVPGIVFASAALVPELAEDRSLLQVANVATLPGVVEASYAMPDIHWGYGFPIGGVAATDVEDGGVVSPGGVGFDISCGVRLLLAPHTEQELDKSLPQLMDTLAARVPHGMGGRGIWPLHDQRALRKVLEGGARYAVEQGHGTARDLDRCEGGGFVEGADPSQVSERAMQRGLRQVGSLGSGNHFLELQAVETVYDVEAAEALGLTVGRVAVMIHTGSRGLGHQVCSDHVRTLLKAMPEAGITVPDDQLACAPVDSAEGRAYLGAMAAAANYGLANRQLLTQATRQSFAETVGSGELDLLYDVSHNLAKIETHQVDGTERRLCVHRKGATRAFPPGHPELPADLSPIGQPVLVPGSMGTGSHVLVGIPEGQAFYSACHGAGRVLSRHAAKRAVDATTLRRELEDAGIRVRGASKAGLAEEAPLAYKDVDEVVAVCERAGLARRVARMRPLGVVKG